MTRLARDRGTLIGAAALALGALALWLGSDAERKPGREASLPQPRAYADQRREASVSTGPVAHEGRARALDLPDATPARGDALRVDVVDSAGRPAAGVSIAFGTVSSSGPGAFEARLRACTDAAGSAWIELPALAAARATDPSDGALRLRAEILAEPVPEVVLAPQVVAARHAVLRLPPTGSVRLEVAGGSDTPAAVRFTVWARAAGTARDVEPLPRRIPAPGGVALLEHVGIGLELRVTAVIDGDGARAERVAGSGPRFQGEERTILVPLGAPWPTVLARVLDEHGDVLRNVLLGAEVRWSRPEATPLWGSEASQALRIRTDDDGRVRLPIRGTVAGGYARRLVLTHPARVRGESGPGEPALGRLREAERELSWDVAAGAEIDLGDVQLRSLEQESGEQVWVSGIVAERSGAPVSTATVLVSAIDAEGTPLRAPAAQASVEPDGRFVVAGPPVEQRLVVRAVAPGFLRSTEEVVASGASGLRIHLQAAARWTGRLRLDPDVPPESLVVEVITPDRRRPTIPASEQVAVDGLEEGWIDVEVRTRAGDWLVERWERLATARAGTPAEARVDELDLRGRLTRLRLRLAHADGTALDHVFARVHPGSRPEGGAWIRAGRIDLVVPSDARTITVQPRGYPPIGFGLLDGIQELTWPALR